jgi:hypothetical protein
MSELRKQLDAKLVQLQQLLDQHFEENSSVQDAFNALAEAIDAEFEELK